MSAELQWMILRKWSNSMIKRNNLIFSTEPNNLKQRHSFRYNGRIHTKSIGVEPGPDNKGIVLVIKKKRGQRKPATSYTRTIINKHPRTTLASVRNTIRMDHYRKDLRMAALRRVSAILRSQKRNVVVKKKSRRTRTPKTN
uniref:large ribosomal subunit protein eL28 n=1 Tax=Myxine glutinosa TaxID=7769 RepID=UPI00358E8230